MIEAKQIRQGKVSRPQSALDAPIQLPPGWEWVNVDSLCFKVTDGTHFTPQYAASGVRFVSAKDIVSGKLVLIGVSSSPKMSTSSFIVGVTQSITTS